MKRMSFPSLVIAISLALLLPIELAHCVWMGIPQHVVQGTAATSVAHACCRAAANARPASPSSPSSPRTCTCIQLPLVTLPSHVTVGAPTIDLVTCLATAHETLPVLIPRIVAAPDRAPLLGSPPRGAQSHAHGLRAPPIHA